MADSSGGRAVPRRGRVRRVRVVTVVGLLAELAGTWRGSGVGSYPTIDDFTYTEELVIAPVPGKPVAHWRSRTADGVTGEPRHAESGFLRLARDRWELVVAHSFGITEISVGPVEPGEIRLTGGNLVGGADAKRVDAVQREYRFNGDWLTYRFAMAAVGVTMTHHLAADLHRQE